ncbi:MAG: hypothetical protein RML32_15140, partial [Gammaproteobacteria bacterium]|nr:hypothetical protein [Gammaproteobacteria bacterium]
VVFQTSDGLVIRSGGEVNQMDAMRSGQVLEHRVTVEPTKEGIFQLNALAVADDGSGPQARSFAIPIIVGDAPAGGNATPTAEIVTDARGERLTRLPANETSDKP